MTEPNHESATAAEKAQSPRQKWRSHLQKAKSTGAEFKRVHDTQNDALREILTARQAIEKTEKPTDEAQQALIDAFDIFAFAGVRYWTHGVMMLGLSAEEDYYEARVAIDDIAEEIRLAGGNISFVRQRARRDRLHTAEARVERDRHEAVDWFDREKNAVAKVCPDFDRLAPKFTVIRTDEEGNETRTETNAL